MMTNASSGFTENGRRFVLREPTRVRLANTDLWNDQMCLNIDHRGGCSTKGRIYASDRRHFYVRDDDTMRFWSSPYDPVQVAPEEFEFAPGVGDVRWRVVTDGLELTTQVVVPRDDFGEVWTARLRNASGRPRNVSLITYLPIGRIGHLRDVGWYDEAVQGVIHNFFWWWCKIEDYFATKDEKYNIVCLSDRRPDSYEVDMNAFLGWGGPACPDALQEKELRCRESHGDPTVAAFQFSLSLDADEEEQFQFFLGPAKDRSDMDRLRQDYLGNGCPQAVCNEVTADLDEYAGAIQIKTPDPDFDAYVNHWLPRRLLFMGRTMRMSAAAQARNAIQDMIGLTYTAPALTRQRLLKIWSFQYADGWMPHGLPFKEGAKLHGILEIPHRDLNVWGPMTLSVYTGETGDIAVLDETVPFAESTESAPLYDHICRGLEWLLADRTERGLARIGQGDWNDPLNMAGRHGHGESFWLTEALAYSLDIWAEFADHRSDTTRAARYRREADACRRAVNEHGWDGAWYARGTRDDGSLFGVSANAEGRIFLNAQGWAFICGAADTSTVDTCINSVREQLDTPSGPMTLTPAFAEMDEGIGKLSMKAPGSSENGSVYCHAAVFYAYGLFSVGRSKEAWRVLRTLLTGNETNTINRSGQLPLYIPNLYRGTAAGPTAGQSSHAANTGTAPWYYLTVVTKLFGMQPDFDGLRFLPELPPDWDRAEVNRTWRGASFDITFIADKKAEEVEVELDGKPLPDNCVPPQQNGTTHAVTVRCPDAVRQ